MQVVWGTQGVDEVSSATNDERRTCKRSRSRAMEQHGNTTTFNLENVLYQNIQTSLYYRETCDKLTTWEHCVDEMYENVDHVEPWMSGNARGPSTAFCLVYRLGELKPTVKQVKDLIDHSDSPYIRAVGEGKPDYRYEVICMGSFSFLDHQSHAPTYTPDS